MPDDRLLDLAATGALRNVDVVEAEARRMLADNRAQALVDNLAGQWLAITKGGPFVEDAMKGIRTRNGRTVVVSDLRFGGVE